ncbi:MBL fold metallo-hydrolase, partial [Marilutibacter aestuarii]
RASPAARFMGPPSVLRLLAEWGVEEGRLFPAREAWEPLAPGLSVHAVPAAHPEIRRDPEGRLDCVGFVLQRAGRRAYLAGDTSVKQALIDALAKLAPIDVAVLPVNEPNFFRARRGIIGNMSVREAFAMADELGIGTVVPVHWDMFAANAVGLDEIRAVYAQMQPAFSLSIQPAHFPV